MTSYPIYNRSNVTRCGYHCDHALSVSALPPDGEGARGAALLEGRRRRAGHGGNDDDGGSRSNVFHVSSKESRCSVHLKRLRTNALNCLCLYTVGCLLNRDVLLSIHSKVLVTNWAAQ